MHSSLSKYIPVSLVENGDDEIPDGVLVVPSYLTKGLEFDGVTAVIMSAEDYMMNEEQLFYTICTRALHRLDICAVNNAGIITACS
jgi:DNA helicase-2/ATP-dependent DNA helicase PcrA